MQALDTLLQPNFGMWAALWFWRVYVAGRAPTVKDGSASFEQRHDAAYWALRVGDTVREKDTPAAVAERYRHCLRAGEALGLLVG